MKRSQRKGKSHPPKKSNKNRNLPRSSSPKSIAPKGPPAIPGEFEPQEALVFGCGQLVRYYPQLFVDFVRSTHERIQLVGIISQEFRRLGDLLLGAAGLPINAVEFIEGTTSSVWARDWSPIVGYDESGRRCQYFLDRSHMRHRDDVVARDIFQKRFPGVSHDIKLSMEGGNFLSNGKGLVLTSQTVEHKNQAEYSRMQIAQLFERTLHADQWASLIQLHAERTGHVDLFATFLAPDLLLIGDVEDDEISNRSLNEAAEKLQGVATAAGKLRVERIPMPSSRDTHFRSYNNVIFANGLLLVPVFPSQNPKLDQRVLAMYREFLPDYDVVGIDLGELALKGGGLHCLSANVPPAERVCVAPALTTDFAA